MSETKKSKINSNFIIQGSVLAVAGILVRIIGMLYRIPISNILKEEGLGYYGTAFNIYSILLILSSQSMPIAVSKLVSERRTRNEYKNIKRTFVGAMIYAFIVGLIFALFTFFGADFLAGLYARPACARALKVLAPTLFVVGIIGVMRGYFQGMGDVTPTAISQLLEQVINAIVSIVAAYMLYSYGKGIAAASAEQSTTNAASFSAAGGTLGTLSGAITAFIVLFYIYHRRKKAFYDDIKNDRTKEESYNHISKVLLLTVTPIIFSTTIYQIGNLLDDMIYGNVVTKFFGYSQSKMSAISGIYNNYKLLTTMPLAIATALTLSLVPAVVNSYKLNKKEEVKEKIDMAFKFTTIIAFPCGVGLSVLGVPIYRLLFPSLEINNMIIIMMSFSVFTVVFYSISTISNSILQSINRLSQPIISSSFALALHFPFLFLMLIVFKFDIHSIVIGDFVFAGTICLINAWSLKRYINYKMNIKDFIIKPLIAALVMGAVAFIVYLVTDFLASALFKSLIGTGRKTEIIASDIGVIFALIFAVVTYFVTLIKIKGLPEETIKQFPMSGILIRLSRKIS